MKYIKEPFVYRLAVVNVQRSKTLKMDLVMVLKRQHSIKNMDISEKTNNMTKINEASINS